MSCRSYVRMYPCMYNKLVLILTNSLVIEVSCQTKLLSFWIIVTLPLSKLLTADALVLGLPLCVKHTKKWVKFLSSCMNKQNTCTYVKLQDLEWTHRFFALPAHEMSAAGTLDVSGACPVTFIDKTGSTFILIQKVDAIWILRKWILRIYIMYGITLFSVKFNY